MSRTHIMAEIILRAKDVMIGADTILCFSVQGLFNLFHTFSLTKILPGSKNITRIKCWIFAKQTVFGVCSRLLTVSKWKRVGWSYSWFSVSSFHQLVNLEQDHLRMNIAPVIKQSRSRWHCPPSFFDLRSSSEVVRMSCESYSSSFRPLIFLPFCLFVFLS